MTDAERQAVIDRLREFADAQRKSAATRDEVDRAADQNSMARALDVVSLYDDGKWKAEIPAPKRAPGRRGVRADSFHQFAKWAENAVGLKRTHLNQLRKAREVAEQISAVAEKYPESERALRPLAWMSKNHYDDRVAEVWAAAIELAGGEHPTSTEVKAALAAWKRDNAPKVENAPRPRKSGRSRALSALETLRREYAENPSEVGPLIDHLHLEVMEQRANVPQTVDELMAMT